MSAEAEEEHQASGTGLQLSRAFFAFSKITDSKGELTVWIQILPV